MKFIPQQDRMDCAPACLAMLSQHYGKQYNIAYLREISYLSRDGVSLLSISEAAKNLGFETFSAKLTIKTLIEEQETLLPCVLHWDQNHFVVLYKITCSFLKKKLQFHIADPGFGLIKIDEDTLKKHWLSDDDNGVALFVKPTDTFYEKNPIKPIKSKFKYLLKFLSPYPKQIALMFLMLFLGSALSLIFPFLTQRLIDNGVVAKDLSYITLILLSQLSLFVGLISVEVLRNWITLYIGTRLSIAVISQFFKKLLTLPIKFFDTKHIGDFNQRIADNNRIENFLTSHSLITLFSLVSFLVYFGVLWYYDLYIIAVYITLSTIAVLWSLFWLKKRKFLDYFLFQQHSENQEAIYEIINGVAEMKLNQMEESKRHQWEAIQEKIFKINIRILKVSQLQSSGYEFISQVKNILVTFLSAIFVIKGSMTLGELLSVSYIIGQMNSPINQLVSFFRSLQDAGLSLERLSEVENHPAEDKEALLPIPQTHKTGILLNELSFQYEGPKSPYILQHINLHIPHGKVTAIVGASGSGKTTLLKLLLKFYPPTQGTLSYNDTDISELSAKKIREQCGVVMQEGYIFSDTIERNICTGDEKINKERLKIAIETANIGDFINTLPLGIHTKIGAAGNGISGGQKQRILIARAVYKNPQYIFFDEATSALDAENEHIIHNNLQAFFKGKTVVIIAHRLSTVKNADQIVVLKAGKIVEIGNHNALVKEKGEYFNLVKNQLELGD
ncbi:peptidase domain-containing ABC transporter [Capnocytophaga leadbetteri]|jgi:probable ABC-type multidrug transport system, ATPase and permease components|uniref:peptidase domain-containing ABC transporter n=1 Tax=Capnocytophaga leadbetteri TaxID=327575 RepID=UPI0026EBB45E|nr:peptidase domain-containing ABC transporter [Capnocytophaga leadbetteri]